MEVKAEMLNSRIKVITRILIKTQNRLLNNVIFCISKKSYTKTWLYLSRKIYFTNYTNSTIYLAARFIIGLTTLENINLCNTTGFVQTILSMKINATK